MAKIYGAIRGQQIATGLAGNGLQWSDDDTLAIDINELSAADIDVANDSIPILDATDSTSKLESVADIVTAIAGDGLAASSGVLAVDLNELTGAVVDVSADSIAIVDANDSNASRKEAVADLVSAIAGSGLTATAGVLSVDSSAAVVEGDIAKQDESAICDGVETSFTLDDTPVTNSLDIYLNGTRLVEGSGKAFTLSGTTVTMAIAPESGDALIFRYIIDN